ncbi:MAG: type II secretion system protein [Elusimicrobiaceae bacterium]|nr:type II secretion system protein [Elusimicrobiaceae bacterium]
MKKAFTLIELLVVVLIIGILAAIALPQYERAVQKARLVEGLVGLRAIRTAIDSYYLANGTYPYDFTELDIDFPVIEYKVEEGIENSRIDVPNGISYNLDVDGYAGADFTKMPKVLLVYYWGEDKYYCRVLVSQETAHYGHNLCKSIGGIFSTEHSKGANSFYMLP